MWNSMPTSSAAFVYAFFQHRILHRNRNCLDNGQPTCKVLLHRQHIEIQFNSSIESIILLATNSNSYENTKCISSCIPLHSSTFYRKSFSMWTNCKPTKAIRLFIEFEFNHLTSKDIDWNTFTTITDETDGMTVRNQSIQPIFNVAIIFFLEQHILWTFQVMNWKFKYHCEWLDSWNSSWFLVSSNQLKAQFTINATKFGKIHFPIKRCTQAIQLSLIFDHLEQ